MARPCGHPLLPVFALTKCGTANPATCTAVSILCSARVCSRQNSHGQAITSHGRVNIRAARVTSFVTCLAPDLMFKIIRSCFNFRMGLFAWGRCYLLGF
ncbi:unnamed protein product [Linum trigynum]|uniref:Secreted protein n=1 Tax=Linum trigynum TaxID=586398 RepID=A0AAV2FST6_9ROSI